ncbi:MAG TPA: class I SAM-dependent methyltransferase [Victivallales bacterium]|nr:class I SAM-dependent methyltransferase [Victivallales bacterium]
MLIEKILKRLQPDVGLNNHIIRERWLQKTLLSLPEGSRILDAGAGTQRYKKFCNHLNYFSQDFGKYDGKGNNTGIQINNFNYGKLDIISDITSIPENDSSFDAIMCIEVLEHLPEPSKAIKEFSRLLKPDGHLIITAPFCSITHFSPYHFCSGFNKYWYERFLTQNGLSITELKENGNFFEFLGQEINRIPYVSKRYSNSPPSILDKLCIYFLLRKLAKWSKKDNGSNSLLCYGFNIHAIKQKHKI